MVAGSAPRRRRVMDSELRLRRDTLEDWQRLAVDAWDHANPPGLGRRHGILSVYTGGGKTLLAAACIAKAAADTPDLRVAVVVPKIALAKQWQADLAAALNVDRAAIGIAGGGGDGSLMRSRIVVFVIDTARAELKRQSADVRSLMLVVDECHRSGSAKNREIYAARSAFRLGLSATPERGDDVDDNGVPLPIEQQAHGRALGPVCFQLDLKDARLRGLLPPYRIVHHGIALDKAERGTYEALCERVRRAENVLLAAGGDPGRYLAYLRPGARHSAAIHRAAADLQTTYVGRKQFLYGATERNRVGREIVGAQVRSSKGKIRALLFNERIRDGDGEDEESSPRDAGAEALYRGLIEDCRRGALSLEERQVALEHSELAADARDAALEGFRDGSVRVLVSVKALVEGINVPETDLGISVASTASARQRIQTLGRVLRSARDAQGRRLPPELQPVKEMHLVYVRDSVDANIYANHDWTDLTGDVENVWKEWDFGALAPHDGAALKPSLFSEETAWADIKELALPQRWNGPVPRTVWSHRAGGVFRQDEAPAVDPLPAVALLERGAPPLGADARGRFKVTPQLGVVLKLAQPTAARAGGWYALGQLPAPLRAQDGEFATGEPAPLPPPAATGEAAPVVIRPGVVTAGGEPRAPGTAPPARQTDADLELAREVEQVTGLRWSAVLQHACLACVDQDMRWVTAARDLLQTRRRGQEALPALNALLGVGIEGVTVRVERLDLEWPELLVYACACWHNGRLDEVRRVREEFQRRRKRVGARNQALAHALGILLNEVRDVWSDAG